MNRSWTIAAALSLGLFLAVQKDSLAADNDKTVTVVVAADDAEAPMAFEMDDDARGRKGGYLGVSLREDTKSNEGGALVEHVADDSPSAKAGLKDGDVIVGIGGDVVRGPGRVTEKLRGAKPGDKVNLDVRRDGRVQKFTVELGARPATAWRIRTSDVGGLSEEQQQELEKSLSKLDQTLPGLEKRIGKMKFYAPGRHAFSLFGRSRPLLGIEMVETTAELREAMGGSKDAGVLVGKVLAGSAAEKCGLRVGDLVLSIDGDKVADAGDLAETIGNKEGKTVDLDVVRDKKTVHLKAVLPKIDEPEDEPTGPRASVWALPARAPRAPTAPMVPKVPIAPIAPTPVVPCNAVNLFV